MGPPQRLLFCVQLAMVLAVGSSFLSIENINASIIYFPDPELAHYPDPGTSTGKVEDITSQWPTAPAMSGFNQEYYGMNSTCAYSAALNGTCQMPRYTTNPPLGPTVGSGLTSKEWKETGTCPEGFRLIMDADQCLQAAHLLGIHSDDAAPPPGSCWFSWLWFQSRSKCREKKWDKFKWASFDVQPRQGLAWRPNGILKTRLDRIFGEKSMAQKVSYPQGCWIAKQGSFALSWEKRVAMGQIYFNPYKCGRAPTRGEYMICTSDKIPDSTSIAVSDDDHDGLIDTLNADGGRRALVVSRSHESRHLKKRRKKRGSSYSRPKGRKHTKSTSSIGSQKAAGGQFENAWRSNPLYDACKGDLFKKVGPVASTVANEAISFDCNIAQYFASWKEDWEIDPAICGFPNTMICEPTGSNPIPCTMLNRTIYPTFESLRSITICKNWWATSLMGLLFMMFVVAPVATLCPVAGAMVGIES